MHALMGIIAVIVIIVVRDWWQTTKAEIEADIILKSGQLNRNKWKRRG